MSEDITKVKADLLSVKGRASELSAEVDRQKKIIGTQADQIEHLDEELAVALNAKDALATANARISQLEAQLKTADALAATAKDAVDAAKQISDALARLSSL